MKKIVVLSLLSVLILVACGKKKQAIADAKTMFDDVIVSVEAANKKIESATNGDEAAEALDAVTDAMLKFKKEGEELEKKYPEMKNDEPPEELKEITDRFTKAMTDFSTLMGSKAVEFMSSEKFMKATQRMSEIQ